MLFEKFKAFWNTKVAPYLKKWLPWGIVAIAYVFSLVTAFTGPLVFAILSIPLVALGFWLYLKWK